MLLPRFEINDVYRDELRHFVASVEARRPPSASLDDGWAEVVDEPSPKSVTSAIDAVLADTGRQRELVCLALSQARDRAASLVAAGLRALLNSQDECAELGNVQGIELDSDPVGV